MQAVIPTDRQLRNQPYASATSDGQAYHHQQQAPHQLGPQTSYSSLANATSYGPAAAAGGAEASAPVVATTTGHTAQGAAPGAYGYGHSRQPSWVLPKAAAGGVPGASSPPRSPTQQASAPALAA